MVTPRLIPKSRAQDQLTDSNLLNIFQETFQTCLTSLERNLNLSDNGEFHRLKALSDDIFEQNKCLFGMFDDLEQDAVEQLQKMNKRLTNTDESKLAGINKDFEQLIIIIEKLSKSKDVDLNAFNFSQVDVNKIENALSKRRIQKRQAGAAKRKSELEENSDDSSKLSSPTALGVGADEAHLTNAEPIKETLDSNCCCPNNVVEESRLCHLQKRIPNQTTPSVRLLKDIQMKNDRDSSPCNCSSYKKFKDDDEMAEELFKSQRRISELEEKLKKKEAEVECAREIMKTMDQSFKETRWALAAEVAEKHDQVQELRRNVTALEEQLRQADMQTHFKDDIIKKMRLELKDAKFSAKPEYPKLCEVVEEVTLHHRLQEGGMEEELSEGETTSFHLLQSSLNNMSPQERLSSLMIVLNTELKNIKLLENKLDEDANVNNAMKDLTTLLLPETHEVSEGKISKDLLHPLLEATCAMLQFLGVPPSLHNEIQGCDDAEVALNLIQQRLENVHKAMEVIPQLKEKIETQERLISNKDETLKIFNSNIAMRNQQVETFAAKVEQLERQCEEQKQVIANLQLALQNCKKFEVKPKEEEIRSLQFDICQLKGKKEIFHKECEVKLEEADRTECENVVLRQKINNLSRELTLLIARSRQQNLISQDLGKKLEQELLERDVEIQALQNKVLCLEKELSDETLHNDRRSSHDSAVIKSLKEKVKGLQCQMRQLEHEYNQMLTDAEIRLLSEKNYADEQKKTILIQNQKFLLAVQHLKSEKNTLIDQIDKADEINAILEKENNERISMLENQLVDVMDRHNREIDAASRKLVEVEKERDMKEDALRRLSMKLAEKNNVEDQLRKQLCRYEKEIAALYNESNSMEKACAEITKRLHEAEQEHKIMLKQIKEETARQIMEERVLSEKESIRIEEKAKRQIKTLVAMLDDANGSCARLQNESLRLIHHIKAERRMGLSSENDERKTDACLDALGALLTDTCRQDGTPQLTSPISYNVWRRGGDSEGPRSLSPSAQQHNWGRSESAWRRSNLKDCGDCRDSVDCGMESGFQSMRHSPACDVRDYYNRATSMDGEVNP